MGRVGGRPVKPMLMLRRISKRRYANPPIAAFDGEGSRRRGGRWTPPGWRVAYASSSLALASLEYFVNLDPIVAPADLVSIHVSIPDGVRHEQVRITSLPGFWRRSPFPQELWAIGEQWLVSASSVCLLVPSAVVPEEFNLLISPSHADIKTLQFSEPAEFSFDPRMWK